MSLLWEEPWDGFSFQTLNPLDFVPREGTWTPEPTQTPTWTPSQPPLQAPFRCPEVLTKPGALARDEGLLSSPHLPLTLAVRALQVLGRGYQLGRSSSGTPGL